MLRVLFGSRVPYPPFNQLPRNVMGLGVPLVLPCVFQQPGEGGYGSGTFDIIEWMAHLQPSRWVKQAGWLDPDLLMTSYFPTMDFTASRTEYTFWALWSAPLLVSTDIRLMSPRKVMRTNMHAAHTVWSATGARVDNG